MLGDITSHFTTFCFEYFMDSRCRKRSQLWFCLLNNIKVQPGLFDRNNHDVTCADEAIIKRCTKVNNNMSTDMKE